MELGNENTTISVYGEITVSDASAHPSQSIAGTTNGTRLPE